MNAQNDSIECGDTHLAEHPTYSAPRLQRLGRVSELTEANSAQAFDGNGYAS
ncbi:MAG: lasso RiPP family leader peptide-containing protein [Brevundimonas sp.]|uniref:lasso RiPP family leader peptide-containing protein n=1 Tax=Brevundimonas sp. TaxID=1871086 RepID=UPI002734D4B4|nr:lasso RiPP family leader peptide-containing protein [Brevundimonas sp.]MDP3376726.1 lasso RiPP family leader peptide-containing protein [Brevundimonas sp.]